MRNKTIKLQRFCTSTLILENVPPWMAVVCCPNGSSGLQVFIFNPVICMLCEYWMTLYP